MPIYCRTEARKFRRFKSYLYGTETTKHSSIDVGRTWRQRQMKKIINKPLVSAGGVNVSDGSTVTAEREKPDPRAAAIAEIAAHQSFISNRTNLSSSEENDAFAFANSTPLTNTLEADGNDKPVDVIFQNVQEAERKGEEPEFKRDQMLRMKEKENKRSTVAQDQHDQKLGSNISSSDINEKVKRERLVEQAMKLAHMDMKNDQAQLGSTKSSLTHHPYDDLSHEDKVKQQKVKDNFQSDASRTLEKQHEFYRKVVDTKNPDKETKLTGPPPRPNRPSHVKNTNVKRVLKEEL